MTTIITIIATTITMKTKFFKILSIMLLACMCGQFVSCKKSKDEPVSPASYPITGVWRMYTSENGQLTPTESYFRIKDDNTADLLGMMGTTANPTYVFYTGIYTSKNGWITITYRSRSFYKIQNNVIRCIEELKDSEKYWVYSNIYIYSNSGNEMTVDINNMKSCVLKKSSLPSYWRSEFSEAPVTPTTELMVEQWNLVCKYILNQDGTANYWVSNNPASSGITFLQNGELGKCNFWANEVWAIENNAGRVGENDGVSFPSSNCSWFLTGKTLTMTCSAYDRVVYDSSGNEISRQHITPSSPITGTYNIYTFSASWLTLYSRSTQAYYSFLRNSNTPSSAPFKLSSEKDALSSYSRFALPQNVFDEPVSFVLTTKQEMISK